jgi:hypothetical protein
LIHRPTSIGRPGRPLAGAKGAGVGARLDCAKHDTGRIWAVREYFAVTDGVGFCLGFGSAVPEEDEQLLIEMAGTFEIRPALPG